MGKTFPQADNILNVFSILDMNEDDITDEKVKQKLNVTSGRQSGYYISACQFLDILDDNRKFTHFGLKLKDETPIRREYRIIQKIISKPVFGEVFLDRLLYGEDYNKKEISQLILFYTDIEKHSVADRRASTVSSWINWIFSKKNPLS